MKSSKIHTLNYILYLDNLLYLIWLIQHVSSSNRTTYSWASQSSYISFTPVTPFSICATKSNTDASNDLDSIDKYDEENLKDLNNIYTLALWPNNLLGKMISLGQQVTENFSVKPGNSFSDVWHTLEELMLVLKDDVIKSLTFTRLPNCQKATPD